MNSPSAVKIITHLLLFCVPAISPSAFASEATSEMAKSVTCVIQHKRLGIPLTFCTGVLIAPNVVATTDTCANPERTLPTKAAMQVRCGSSPWSQVKGSTTNPDYKTRQGPWRTKDEENMNFSNDLALLQLEAPLPQTPAALEIENQEYSIQKCILVGYGTDEKYAAPKSRVVDANAIEKWGPKKRFIVSPKISLVGDLGAPLFCQDHRSGKLVLRGINVGSDQKYNFFSRVGSNPVFFKSINNKTSRARPIKTSPKASGEQK